jgi:O-antigen/teichoic acid export membrane protein
MRQQVDRQRLSDLVEGLTSLRAINSWVATEFFWVGLGQVLVLLAGLVSVRVLTPALGAEEYGALSLALSLALLPPQLLYGPLCQGVTRFYAAAREQGKGIELIASTVPLMAAIVAVTILLALTIAIFVRPLLQSTFNRQWPLFLLGACLLSTIEGYSLTLDGIQSAARQRIAVSWHQNLSKWGRLALAVAFITFWGSRALWVLNGFIIAAVIVAISQTCFLTRLVGFKVSDLPEIEPAVRQKLTRQIFSYALPFASWGIFGWAQFASDRWSLQIFWSSAEVGMYATLSQIGYTPFLLLGNMILQFITPILFEKIGDNTTAQRRDLCIRHLFQAIIIMSAIMAGSAVACWLGHRFVFRLLTSPAFWELSPLLPLVVLAAGLFNVGQLLTMFSQAFCQSQRLILPKIAFALLNIGLNIGLGKLYGSAGIVGALLLSSLLYVGWMVLLSSNQLRAYRQKS